MHGKKIILATICCILLIGSSIAYASYGTVHILLGNFSNKSSDKTTINVYSDSSVASYGYTAFVNNAKTGWDNASASLTLGTTTSSSCSECIAVYVGSDFLAPGYIGWCDFWYKNFLGIWTERSFSSVESGTNFERARVRLDDDHLTTAGANSTTNTMNAGHEFGHALSLAHFNNSPAHSGDHWMKTGLLSLSAPTATDKDHLTTKWGP